MEVGNKITIIGQTPLTNPTMLGILSDFKQAHIIPSVDIVQVNQAVEGI